MTFFAIGQEETDEELANFRKWAVVQISSTGFPTCVIGPFDSVADADNYLDPSKSYDVVEMIPPNPTVMRLMREHNTPNKETNA